MIGVAMVPLLLFLAFSFVCQVIATDNFVLNLDLYDTSSNPGVNIGPVESGMVFDLATIGSELTVIARVNSTVTGYVVFKFDGTFTNKEQIPLYALNGNFGSYLNSFEPLAMVGEHTLVTEFYNYRSDALLDTVTTTFTITDTNGDNGPITRFTLVNTITGDEVTLPSVIDLQKLGKSLSIVAYTRPKLVDDVLFMFDKKFIRVENGKPWAINGNEGLRIFPFGPLVVPGVHTVMAIAQGFNQETLGNLTFTFIVQDTVPTNAPSSALSPTIKPTLRSGRPTLGPSAPTTSPTQSYVLSVVPTQSLETDEPTLKATNEPSLSPTVIPTSKMITLRPTNDKTLTPVTAIPTSENVVISGELTKWHKVTLSFTGPFSSETDPTTNPFMDFRLDVTFTHELSQKQYVVPGYYAADGNAAETSASDGTQWHCHFSPDEIGFWNYDVSFVAGKDVSVNGGGEPSYFDGSSGAFEIMTSDKVGRDHRGKGRLQYVGAHHLQFAEGEWFLKAGADRYGFHDILCLERLIVLTFRNLSLIKQPRKFPRI